MFGYDIDSILKKDKNVYNSLLGIISIDQVKTLKFKPMDFAIVNQDLSGHSGKHWLVFNCDLSKSLQCFDRS